MDATVRLDSGRGPILFSSRALLAALLSFSCGFSLGFEPAALASAAPNSPSKSANIDPALKGLPISGLTADEAIVPALNRLAYGPRPGDVERIKKMGLAKWIDQQLNPGSIDEKLVEARLDRYPTLRMSSATLIADYPRPKQAAKQGADKELRREQAAERRAEAAEMREREKQGASGTDAE